MQQLYSQGFGGMLKAIGYNLNEKDQSNWFNSGSLVFNNTTLTTGFNLAYYVGLEDDHDMGLKYMHRRNLNIKLHF
jgi:hypothetical protein